MNCGLDNQNNSHNRKYIYFFGHYKVMLLHCSKQNGAHIETINNKQQTFCNKRNKIEMNE